MMNKNPNFAQTDTAVAENAKTVREEAAQRIERIEREQSRLRQAVEDLAKRVRYLEQEE